MIRYENVSCGYSSKIIVKNASFRAEKGRITFLIGKNGAGKTTLASCINGSVRYTGRICIDDKDIKEISPSQRARMIAFLPQFLKNTPFTVRELTLMGRRPYQGRISPFTEQDYEMAERAMKLSDVISFSERRVSTLSGGEKQRAYLSMVLAQDTQAIVLDEAFSHLDASVENELSAMLKMITGTLDKTVLLISHSLTRCINDADRIVALDDGGIKADMSREEMEKSDIIQTLFKVKKGTLLMEDGSKKTVYI